MTAFYAFLVFGFLIVAKLVMADASIVVPDGDPLTTLLTLVTSLKTMSPLAIASSVIVLVVQGVKKFLPGFQYTKVIVVLGGIFWAFVQSMTSGLSPINAGIFVLLTSGGAIAIYEVFKTPLNAIFAVPK